MDGQTDTPKTTVYAPNLLMHGDENITVDLEIVILTCLWYSIKSRKVLCTFGSPLMLNFLFFS